MSRLWKNTDIVILGLSKTGIATAKYLSSKGASCLISEKRPQQENDIEIVEELKKLSIDVEMGKHNFQSIDSAYLVVTSPGIPPTSEVINYIKKNKIPFVSEPELAFIETYIPIIVVTGTNGKTTTTNLINEILLSAELNSIACGNLGKPIISEIDKHHDYLVAELSSFQLEYSRTLKPQIAVFLNYSPDHIDWHGSEEEYFNSKTNFLINERSPLWAVLNAKDEKIFSLKDKINSKIYWFGTETKTNCCFIQDNNFVIKEKDIIIKVFPVINTNLLGEHNEMNIMAAIATARIAGVSIENIAETLKTFQPVEHRLEFVEEINGKKFYNDSKATNCDSTICAIKSFKNKKMTLILGGKDKGTNLEELCKNINETVGHVIIFGEATDRFKKTINESGFKNLHIVKDIESSINKALELDSDFVVLSPACSSYDMFKNFEERGNVFKNIILEKKS